MDSLAQQMTIRHMKSVYEMYEKNEAVDVHFTFNNDPLMRISAHKLILSAESPVFKTMFYGAMKEKDEIKMVDTPFDSFAAFVKTMYHQFDAINMENISDIVCLADRYDVQNVMEVCTKFLSLNANANNVCNILSLALRYELTALQSECDALLALHSKQILKSSSFLEIDCTTLAHIVKSQFVFLREKDKLDACFKWTKHSCERNTIDSTPENMRSLIGLAFDHIRFDQIVSDFYIRRI